MPFLEVQNLRRTFGGVTALDNVNLQLFEGEILGLIGPNGAGKTTLFNIVTGLTRPSSGMVVFKGEDITGLKPHAIARKGIGRTFQHLALWRDQTVAENVRNALYMHAGLGVAGSLIHAPGYRKQVRVVDNEVAELLGFVGMQERSRQLAKTLSHGYQKTLSLAIGMAVKPSVLLLDEPLAALNPERANHIVGLVKSIREQGVTIVVIEHNMRAIFSLCDRIVVLNAGMNIAEGSPGEIRDDQEVIAAYLGGGSRA